MQIIGGNCIYLQNLNTTLMKLISFAKAAAMAMIVTMFTVGCEKPDNGPVASEDTLTNFFVYDGYSFDIRSAVQYDKSDNSVELWLSPISGLTKSKEIKEGGDYVVLNTHKSYLGDRDRFSAAQSKESYISFCEQTFAYGNSGTAYIEVQFSNDSLLVSFLAEKLYTKADDKPLSMLSGEYKGTFTVEKDKQYANDWGFDREHAAIAKAVVTTREDGGNSTITLFEANGKEGIRIELPHSCIGKEYRITASEYPEEIKLYAGKSRFALKGAAGTIKTSVNETETTVSISLSKDGRQLRAEYSGAYESESVKTNRFIFDYEGESPYEGEKEIVKLMVEDKGGVLKLFFSPSEGYTMSEANSTHMPILTIPSSVVNAGKKTFKELTDWEFAYDVMQSWPYTDEYRPHPADTDWIEINREGNVYEIEFVLTSQGTGSYTGTIDVYYKGEAR